MTRKGIYLNYITCFLVQSGFFIAIPFAHAHVEQSQAISFVTGLGHPWSGLDHVLAMIAVGLWGAQLGNWGRTKLTFRYCILFIPKP
jgi:hydrogenase/urease accessory protein HupE